MKIKDGNYLYFVGGVIGILVAIGLDGLIPLYTPEPPAVEAPAPRLKRAPMFELQVSKPEPIAPEPAYVGRTIEPEPIQVKPSPKPRKFRPAIIDEVVCPEGSKALAGSRGWECHIIPVIGTNEAPIID